MKNKIQSLIADFQDTFDNMPETLSEDAKKDMEARAVKKEMNKDKNSFTKYLPLYEMITQTGEYSESGGKSIAIPKRKPKKMGGLLEDDNERIGYASGSTDGSGGVYDDFEKSNRPFIRELAELQTADKPEKNMGEKAADFLFGDDLESYIESQINDKAKTARQMGFKDYPRSYYTNEIAAEVKEIEKNKNPLLETREIRNEGGSLLDNDMVMEEPAIEQPMMEEPMMEQPQEDMLPDDEMEDNFIDFILDEALSEEEEDMLMSRLEQDDQLSMLFDKVIDVAQEFAGSGPVEGPGSGVSDSIPARLSDGEFVFTAAAVEEIGADNLMAMMKDAEMKAEERQGLVEGGMPDEEETVTMKVQEQKEPKVQIAKATVNNTRGLLDEDEISKGIKSKMMLDPLQRHVRS
jgi:hypothetical protein